MDCRKATVPGCACLSLVISVIFALIIGTLFFFHLIPSIVISIWIALGLGVLTLILLFAALLHPCGILAHCLCRYGRCLLVGSLGTIFFALAALSIILSSPFLLLTFLVFLGAFFTALLFLSLYAFFLCILRCLCSRQEQDL